MLSGYHKAFLTLSLLLFGTCSSLLARWANESLANGAKHYDNPRRFQHPFVQGVAVFIGQFLCLFPYLALRCFCKSNPEANRVPVGKCFLFVLPAVLQIIASTTIYIGLNFTYQSSYVMLRGTLVVFTGLLSVAFLGRSIRMYMWVGIATLTVGLFVAGLAEVFFPGVSTDANGIVAGDLLIILGLIVFSTQFVYEEKYLKKHNVPATLAVGLEGLFGGAILGALLVPMYYIRASKPFSMNPGHLEDIWDALIQMRNNWHIAAATIALVASSSVSAYFGVKVTKEMSAATRQVIISGRVFLVWVVALGLKWEPFEKRLFMLKLAGFVLLIVGILIYLDLIFRPVLIRHHCLKRGRRQGFGEENEGYNTDRDDEDDHLMRDRD